MSLLVKIAVLVLILAALPAKVLADDRSFSYKFVDGPNIIIVTHNVHDVEAGVPITYNLRLYTLEAGLPIDFERAQVNIKHDSRVVFGKSLLSSPHKDASFTYAYAEKGRYTLSLIFLGDDRTIAVGDFPIVVEPGQDETVLSQIFSAQTAIAFLLGVGVTKLYLERHRIRQLVGVGKHQR